MTELVYNISNLDCAGCAAKIENAVGKLAGVNNAALDFVNKKLTVHTEEEDITKLDELINITAAGIEDGVLLARCSNDTENKPEEKNRFVSTVVAVCFLFSALIVSALGAPDAGKDILMICGILFAGYDCIYGGIKSLFSLRMNEKLLMSIAIISAMFLGDFFEAAMVAILFRIGTILENYAVARSRKNIEALADICPNVAMVQREDGTTEQRDAGLVKIGETICIAPHARVPLDGEILSGTSTLDASALTGESIPIEAQEGGQVLSGMLNGNGLLTVKVTNSFSDSAATRIIKSVRDSAAQKGRSEKFITRFAAIYTPVVVAMAAILAVAPPLLGMGEWADYIHRALTFLVASCPCALVISVPLGFFSAVGGATKMGVLVKGGRYIEQLSKLHAVAFDKTGTLTTGKLNVKEVLNYSTLNDGDLLRLMASCERYSSHPIAEAIKNAVEKEFIPFENYSEESGLGVSCEYKGKKMICGSASYMKKNGISLEKTPSANAYIACDDELLGAVTMSDELRPDIKESLHNIKRQGISHMVVLSGDSPPAVVDVAKRCGINEIFPSLKPEDKTAILKQIKSLHGNTAFIGDGINDAPVLAEADVGIAMGLGAESAIETADAVLTSGNIGALAKAIQFSKRSMHTIYGLIIFSLIVKALVLLLAVWNLAPMWAAIFADVGVTLISVAIASSLLFPKK